MKMGVAGTFFEPYLWNSKNLLLFSRCTNHISTTFWIFWLYKSCKKWWSLPLQVFRASCTMLCIILILKDISIHITDYSGSRICRQGGWSCVGRKDWKKCNSESVLYSMYTLTDLCYSIYNNRYDESKAKGYKPICTIPKSQCLSSVRLFVWSLILTLLDPTLFFTLIPRGGVNFHPP